MPEAFERTPWTVTTKTVVPYSSMRDIHVRNCEKKIIFDAPGGSREQFLMERLVMAVNALAGVSMEAVESGVLRDVLKESGLVPMEA